jgi:hypothetical protein
MLRFTLASCVFLSLVACGFNTSSYQTSPTDRCEEYGFKAGTDAFANCVGQETRNDKQLRQQAKIAQEAANEAFWRDLNNDVVNYCSSYRKRRGLC